jgi:glycosyltransferase involved in cell wall biosynthesis
MNRVLIIEAQIKQYRFPFYQGLRTELARSGIELSVGYSDPNPAEASKRDNSDLPPEYGKKVRGYWLFGDKVLLQPLLISALRADLVIVDQANKFVLNHLLLPLSRLGLKRVAFWGHGENFQPEQLRFSEWYRRKTLSTVSWWFAYTERTARYLISNGVSPSRITAVDNAVDTSAIRRDVSSISAEHRIALRKHLGISESARVGIFCGMLDKIKSVPFLLDAAKLIRDRISDFHLILVGGGPDETSIQAAAARVDWIHYMGPQFGKRKSELLAISDILLMPGKVGLVILDAFAAGLPFLTTHLTIHCPEIEYLQQGFNGLLSEPNVSAFANMTASLLQDRESLERLRQGARESGSKYTIENMVTNFELGIRQCLGTAVRSPIVPEVNNRELADR